ncbi:MAG: DUF883 domain-containing protein [Nitrosomonas sp.]|nr:MAG: DUF883 domain-containing protein [Nitrosomonas sp.]
MRRAFDERKDELLSEVRSILKDAEAMYESIVDDGTDKTKQLKKNLKAKIEKARVQFDDIEDNLTDIAQTTVKDTDTWIRDNPYVALGAVFSLGMIIALLLKDNSRR